MSDREREQWLGLLSAAITVLAMWLAADPDAPGRWYYRFRLWLAYRNAQPNQDRLSLMRQRARAGLYADDMTATATTIREVSS